MQEQMVTIYRPTVHLQQAWGFKMLSEEAGRKKYCVEMNAVICNAFSIA